MKTLISTIATLWILVMPTQADRDNPHRQHNKPCHSVPDAAPALVLLGVGLLGVGAYKRARF